MDCVADKIKEMDRIQNTKSESIDDIIHCYLNNGIMDTVVNRIHHSEMESLLKLRLQSH